MPDQIGSYYTLNKLQPPADHNWKLNKITREFVDGDAWQRIAKRADETVHECRFFVATAALAKDLKKALYLLSGQAGLTMICDGQEYDEIVVTAVSHVQILPMQRHSKCIAADGTADAGGIGGRLVVAVIKVGRSNQPDPDEA